MNETLIYLVTKTYEGSLTMLEEQCVLLNNCINALYAACRIENVLRLTEIKGCWGVLSLKFINRSGESLFAAYHSISKYSSYTGSQFFCQKTLPFSAQILLQHSASSFKKDQLFVKALQILHKNQSQQTLLRLFQTLNIQPQNYTRAKHQFEKYRAKEIQKQKIKTQLNFRMSMLGENIYQRKQVNSQPDQLCVHLTEEYSLSEYFRIKEDLSLQMNLSFDNSQSIYNQTSNKQRNILQRQYNNQHQSYSLKHCKQDSIDYQQRKEESTITISGIKKKYIQNQQKIKKCYKKDRDKKLRQQLIKTNKLEKKKNFVYKRKNRKGNQIEITTKKNYKNQICELFVAHIKIKQKYKEFYKIQNKIKKINNFEVIDSQNEKSNSSKAKKQKQIYNRDKNKKSGKQQRQFIFQKKLELSKKNKHIKQNNDSSSFYDEQQKSQDKQSISQFIVFYSKNNKSNKNNKIQNIQKNLINVKNVFKSKKQQTLFDNIQNMKLTEIKQIDVVLSITFNQINYEKYISLFTKQQLQQEVIKISKQVIVRANFLNDLNIFYKLQGIMKVLSNYQNTQQLIQHYIDPCLHYVLQKNTISLIDLMVEHMFQFSSNVNFQDIFNALFAYMKETNSFAKINQVNVSCDLNTQINIIEQKQKANSNIQFPRIYQIQTISSIDKCLGRAVCLFILHHFKKQFSFQLLSMALSLFKLVTNSSKLAKTLQLLTEAIQLYKMCVDWGALQSILFILQHSLFFSVSCPRLTTLVIQSYLWNSKENSLPLLNKLFVQSPLKIFKKQFRQPYIITTLHTLCALLPYFNTLSLFQSLSLKYVQEIYSAFLNSSPLSLQILNPCINLLVQLHKINLLPNSQYFQENVMQKKEGRKEFFDALGELIQILINKYQTILIQKSLTPDFHFETFLTKTQQYESVIRQIFNTIAQKSQNLDLYFSAIKFLLSKAESINKLINLKNDKNEINNINNIFNSENKNTKDCFQLAYLLEKLIFDIQSTPKLLYLQERHKIIMKQSDDFEEQLMVLKVQQNKICSKLIEHLNRIVSNTLLSRVEYHLCLFPIIDCITATAQCSSRLIQHMHQIESTITLQNHSLQINYIRVFLKWCAIHHSCFVRASPSIKTQISSLEQILLSSKQKKVIIMVVIIQMFLYPKSSLTMMIMESAWLREILQSKDAHYSDFLNSICTINNFQELTCSNIFHNYHIRFSSIYNEKIIQFFIWIDFILNKIFAQTLRNYAILLHTILQWKQFLIPVIKIYSTQLFNLMTHLVKDNLQKDTLKALFTLFQTINILNKNIFRINELYNQFTHQVSNCSFQYLRICQQIVYQQPLLKIIIQNHLKSIRVYNL